MTLHTMPADQESAPKAENRDPLEDFDCEAARRDGWTLSACGSYNDGARHIELQKDDDPALGARYFREDREAWLHVVAQARRGSPLHCHALDLIDRRERLGIEAVCGLW